MEEKKVTPNEQEKVISLDMPEVKRTSIWINGDCTKVVRLNLSDMNIMTRAKDAIGKLEELQAEANHLASVEVPDSFDTDEDKKKLDEAIEMFRKIDKQMRAIVDEIFDFPVCDVCCDGGSMYDPFEGKYRYEYIIDKLMALYGDTWERETKKSREQMNKHTAKYTKSRKKK